MERLSPVPPPLNLPQTVAGIFYHYTCKCCSTSSSSSLGYTRMSTVRSDGREEEVEIDVKAAKKSKTKLAIGLLRKLKLKQETEKEGAS